MKTDFNFSVAVNLGVTPELTALMTQLFGYLGNHAPATQSSDKTQEEVAPKVESEKSQKAEEPKPQAGEEEVKPEPTEEDVRAAMHRARMHIEGEDYKDNTDGELYKKYHKNLTAEFKRLASLFGADKPSLLSPENRGSFINACNELTILPTGNIGSAVPF